MSISVNLRRIFNLPGRSDRKILLSLSHPFFLSFSLSLSLCVQYFRWPHYGKVVKDEVFTVSVYNISRVFSNRLLGKLVVSLQHVVTSGRLLLREPLTDANYCLTTVMTPTHTDTNIFHFSSLSQKNIFRPNELEREVRRLGQSLLLSGEEDEDDMNDDYDDDLETSNIILTPLLRSVHLNVLKLCPIIINVNILEAQKLAGVNINPAVFIRVGDQKRHTMTQKSTNCPYYSENFLFEFQEAPQVLFDKVIEIKVFHRRILAFLMTHIGTFKIDINTIYNQTDHRFYQKWAPLTDPADTRSGIRGYVKATLSVLMKGDAVDMSSLLQNLLLPRGMPSERPWARFRIRIYRAEGLPTMDEGLMAKMSRVTDRTVFIDPYVKVTFAGQQGETSVASATSCPVWNEEINFIEQFPPLAQRIRIQVLDDAKMGDIALATHFLDLLQISDPTRNGFNPTFGPCWVNLYGSPQNSTLGDVHQALNQGLGEGIFYRGRVLVALCVEVYVSPSAPVVDAASAGKGLNELNSDCLLFPIASMADSESGEAGIEVPESVTVETEETHPLPEGFLGELEDFLLFASIFEITMMDPSVGTRPLTFELSIGNYGKVVRMKKSKKNQSREDEETQNLLDSEEELDREEVQEQEPEMRSVSDPMRPEPTEYDRSYQCVPLQPPSVKQKPCLFIWTQYEDHSFRFYQTNWLSKMADRLEMGLDDVERLLRRPRSNAKERLVEVLLGLVASCRQFSVFGERRSQFRPNHLDKCRRGFIKKNLILLARQAVRAKRRITRKNTKQRLMDSRKLLKKLRFLSKEPQSTIPDVFLWLLRGTKRLAYIRIPSHSIFYALVEEQKGRDCGRVTTFYMKSPGSSSSEIFAKLEVYLWFGPSKYSKEATGSLPQEFLPIYVTVHFPFSFTDSRYFQLRCHMYQARGLIAADDNGLSDPFAKVIFSTQCQVTRVGLLNQTLSPAWCECLLFDRVLLEGTREELEGDPPLIIINIFDHDAVGSPKSLGRAYAYPEFKPVELFYKKPSLRFFDISKGRAATGELLAAFELIELDYSCFGEPGLPKTVDPQELTLKEDERYYNIPEGVRPVLKTFRIEVLFWGLRELKRVQLFEVERPLVRVECAGHRLESEEIESYKDHPNFKELVRYIDVKLPEQAYLHPPLTLFVVEHRAFGRIALVGSNVVQSLMDYAPPELGGGLEEEDEEEPKPRGTNYHSIKMLMLMLVLPLKSPFKRLKKKEEELEEEVPEKEELDWWSKYYASLYELEKEVGPSVTGQWRLTLDSRTFPKSFCCVGLCLQLYARDLEMEYKQFQDWLKIFPLYKGKALGEDEDEDEEDRWMGKFKGSFLIYPINPEDTDETKCQITEGIPKNSPIKVLVRVYIIKATNLAPTDPNGKADPYLVLKVGPQSQNTKDRYIPKQLNPVFGEVFEFTVSFPLETDLLIKVMDHDLVGSDDAIGETQVDLENRFYSRHRASCGLALYYDTDGYNIWRDAKKPTTILGEFCRENSIPAPEYRTQEVKVLNKIFKIPPDAIPEALLKKNELTPEEEEEMEEHAALSVLHRWVEMKEFLPSALPLVPEHVEVRSLQNQDKPGMPQGYLHMWVDMFPTDVPAPPPVDIKLRKPEQYELRVIIWNTDDVFLEDINPFTGDPSSDIYVKGWIKGLEKDKQETDVHFNSLTGEGNFNWRFLFRFDYLPTEKEVVYKKKESFFSLDESEFRQPAVLVLQVWDYDRILSNDFLGSVELRLNDMVRPAKSSGLCKIDLAKDRAMPRFSIFRSKKMKGWWPLTRQKTAKDYEREEKEKKDKKKKKKSKDRRSRMKEEELQFTDSSGNTFLLMGKVEAELQLVTLEQAEANPVGRKRKEPEPLDKPNRPTTNFNWFINPMKTFIFLIWRKFKKFIIALIILGVLTVFLVLIIYTLPQQISSLIING
uniref:Fer-1-like protein 4 n=1 Tax=Cynoglossus semilaevis TaxID=244447 RepID=A0A3P8W1F5_CYNSE